MPIQSEISEFRVPGSGRTLQVHEYSIGAQRRKLFVIDEVIDEKVIAKVYHHFRSMPYRFADSDRPDTLFVKHLVHHFETQEWQNDKVIKIITQFAETFLEEKGLTQKGIRRIYTNFNLFGDFQFKHEDGDEWTALTFVNEKWSEDWSGELMVYEENPKSPCIAVQPLPGRMVIFDGLLSHRGGVPSKLCFEPRLSVAIKFARK